LFNQTWWIFIEELGRTSNEASKHGIMYLNPDEHGEFVEPNDGDNDAQYNSSDQAAEDPEIVPIQSLQVFNVFFIRGNSAIEFSKNFDPGFFLIRPIESSTRCKYV